MESAWVVYTSFPMPLAGDSELEDENMQISLGNQLFEVLLYNGNIAYPDDLVITEETFRQLLQTRSGTEHGDDGALQWVDEAGGGGHEAGGGDDGGSEDDDSRRSGTDDEDDGTFAPARDAADGVDALAPRHLAGARWASGSAGPGDRPGPSASGRGWPRAPRAARCRPASRRGEKARRADPPIGKRKTS
jgi:hypothetical protein